MAGVRGLYLVVEREKVTIFFLFLSLSLSFSFFLFFGHQMVLFASILNELLQAFSTY